MEDDGPCHQDGDHDDHDDELCVEIMIMMFMTNDEKLLTFLKWLKILVFARWRTTTLATRGS